MSDYDRNNRYNINYERELDRQQRQGSFKKQSESDFLLESNPISVTTQEAPKPEPRRKLMRSFVKVEPQLEDELAMDNQHLARLVTIRHQPHDFHVARPLKDHRTRVDIISHEVNSEPERLAANHSDLGRLQESQGKLMVNQNVDGCTKHGVDYHDDETSGLPKNMLNHDNKISPEIEPDYAYYRNADELDVPARYVPRSNELEALSRQSLVPVHELIAYYQYIQHGERGQSTSSSASTSRQSSSASQQTTRTKRSLYGSPKSSSEYHEDYKLREIDPASSSQEFCSDDGTLTGESSHQNPSEHCVGPKIVVENLDSSQLECHAGIGHKQSEMSSSADIEMASCDHETSLNRVLERRRLRANVISELINSERDYVKHLNDVVDGYLHRARKQLEIFTSQRINTIFANIEQLFEFQKKFLQELEQCINWDDLALSEVGACFTKYEKGFSIYHYYCNNHPNATSELQELYNKPIFRAFFEECRLKQNMIDISLDGFLLTPIQRICKYPLQLNELLKNTEDDHPDYLKVLNALDTMRNCANLANERKRRIEALADIMLFQERFDNWFGSKLSDTSSILIHSGEVSKMGAHTWSQGVQLYLFDHLLLYSKKDLLKRNNLILKGRICMDSVTEITDANEYKSRKSFKLYCSEQQKWFIFITKSEKEKDDWIQAFEKERNLVESDENEGFQITDRELGIARQTLLHRKRSRSARYRTKRPDTTVADQTEQDDPEMMINRTLSLPSCIHPSHVMNFVEDSRASSGTTVARKKDSSPSATSRSPLTSSMQLLEHQDLQSSGPGNWLKKMGSKKLTKSQIYNINGQTGFQQQQLAQSKSQINTKTDLNGATSLLASDAAAQKYEELEKRYRDHMISEEQARLYRLNNDQASTIYNRPVTPSIAHQVHNGGLKTSDDLIGARRPSSQPSLRDARMSTNESCAPSSRVDGKGLEDFNALNIGDGLKQQMEHTGMTFETDLVLSSGRVVRVREDAV